MNQLVATLIPLLVPAALAVLKHLAPRLPKVWLPILAPLLGALIEALASGDLGPGTPLGAALGAAGVGLREILDQLRKRRAAAAAGTMSLLLAMALAGAGGPGCRSPETALYRTAASVEATVDAAMKAWGDYVVWRRQALAQTPDPAARAALEHQEAAVRQLFAAYRAAMDNFYEARAAAGADPAAVRAAVREPLARAQAAAADLCARAQSLAARPAPAQP